MTRPSRAARGASLIEVLVVASLAVSVLVGAAAMVDASAGVAHSAEADGQAHARMQHALQPLAEALRHGSLASVRHVDGTNFKNGTSDTGFQVRRVLGWRGGPVVSGLVTYRLDRPSGAKEGQIVRVDGPIESVLATGVSAFRVARAGDRFTIDVATRCGPGDDRGRATQGSMLIATRNP